MKKILVLNILFFASIFLLQSCSGDDNGTKPSDKQDITIAKTNSNLMIPLALGNKWVYMSSDSVTETWEIKSIISGYCKEYQEPKTFPDSNYTLYVLEKSSSSKTFKFGFYQNKVFFAANFMDTLFYAVEAYDEILGVRDLGPNKNYIWREWLENLDVTLDFAIVNDAKFVIYETMPDEKTISNAEVVKKGVGIVKFWTSGKVYTLKEVVLN